MITGWLFRRALEGLLQIETGVKSCKDKYHKAFGYSGYLGNAEIILATIVIIEVILNHWS